jgi:Fe-S oxidoreductase
VLGNYFANFIEATATEGLREFEVIRADPLITACPYCKENFEKAINEKMRVKDLIELVDERI